MKIIGEKKPDIHEWIMRGFALTISVLLIIILVVQINMKM